LGARRRREGILPSISSFANAASDRDPVRRRGHHHPARGLMRERRRNAIPYGTAAVDRPDSERRIRSGCKRSNHKFLVWRRLDVQIDSRSCGRNRPDMPSHKCIGAKIKPGPLKDCRVTPNVAICSDGTIITRLRTGVCGCVGHHRAGATIVQVGIKVARRAAAPNWSSDRVLQSTFAKTDWVERIPLGERLRIHATVARRISAE
jgi:hypothetical protein